MTNQTEKARDLSKYNAEDVTRAAASFEQRAVLPVGWTIRATRQGRRFGLCVMFAGAWDDIETPKHNAREMHSRLVSDHYRQSIQYFTWEKAVFNLPVGMNASNAEGTLIVSRYDSETFETYHVNEAFDKPHIFKTTYANRYALIQYLAKL